MGTTAAQRREAEFRAYAHDWDTAFLRALQAAADAVEGLRCLLRGHGALPSLHWDGDPHGAYSVGAGLRRIDGIPFAQLRAFAWLEYDRDSEDEALRRDERALDLELIAGPAPALVAALVVAGAAHHHATLA